MLVLAGKVISQKYPQLTIKIDNQYQPFSTITAISHYQSLLTSIHYCQHDSQCIELCALLLVAGLPWRGLDRPWLLSCKRLYAVTERVSAHIEVEDDCKVIHGDSNCNGWYYKSHLNLFAPIILLFSVVITAVATGVAGPPRPFTCTWTCGVWVDKVAMGLAVVAVAPKWWTLAEFLGYIVSWVLWASSHPKWRWHRKAAQGSFCLLKQEKYRCITSWTNVLRETNYLRELWKGTEPIGYQTPSSAWMKSLRQLVSLVGNQPLIPHPGSTVNEANYQWLIRHDFLVFEATNRTS